jgi:hypothetical protein
MARQIWPEDNVIVVISTVNGQVNIKAQDIGTAFAFAVVKDTAAYAPTLTLTLTQTLP